ncbi:MULTISPECIES: TetR/AcrR family transcriptional regulator [Sinorhizobium]|jgi:TetR/AcrR family transcriptional repressor of nem operon|uniref:TetR/AcrR family transcriptional regulator n=1 Tax=Sinorhizobium TaxID=28105 RepID=UPI000369EFA0|nr:MULTISPECIES: TetR/AcrR family transcriptional regulator [Sinorhizobium]PND19544.1 TetR/AcrR family transcriptional regulator [Ensifer sp. MMN_5]PND29470.1 TetR/AcrR family transcriptional regulator [Sinorhizobium sp. M4_45]
MARPREFDEEAVLNAASDIFWTRGYKATSTRELTARTGLTPSSMYAAFGDKRGLFRRALDHYLNRLREKMAHLEATASPGQAITGFFEDTIERSLGDALQRGCMLVNSALEASSEDAEFRSSIARELNLIEEFFRSRVTAGQECGDISRAHSAKDAARQLLAVLSGVRVLARVRPERPLLTGAVGQTLALLGLPPLAAPAAASIRESKHRAS